MESRNTPSSPPAEEVQEDTQSNEVFQADDNFRAAPSTFAFAGPVPANTVVANVPSLGSNELGFDNDPNAEYYDPSLNPIWRYQARRRTRSLDISPTRRNPRGVDDNANLVGAPIVRRYDGRTPPAVQPPQLEQQFVQPVNYNYLHQPTNVRDLVGLGNVPRGGAGVRPNETPRIMEPVHRHANPRAGRRRRDMDTQVYIPPQTFPSYLAEHPTRFESQREQDAASYQRRPRQQQTPRAQAIGGPPPQIQRQQQTPRPQAIGGFPPQIQRQPQIPPPRSQFRAQQQGDSIVPPGDVVRWMQGSQQQGQQGNVAGGPYDARFLQGYPPQGPRLPQNPYPGANFGQATATQGSVRPSQYLQGTINPGRAPSGYGQPRYYPNTMDISAGESAQFAGSRITRPAEEEHPLFLFRPSEDTRPPAGPTGPLRIVGRHSPWGTPPGHRRIREEAAAAERDAERNRKRQRPFEDESNDESMDDSLLEAETRRQTDNEEEDDDEDESRQLKKPSRKAKPARKKPKTSSKKKADPKKAQGSKRAPKTRKVHGELVQRADGTFWFRANDTAPWEPTVRHDPNRAEMLADARQDPANPNGPYREYDVEPRAGAEAHNRTSYLESHRRWFYRKPHDWHHETLDPIFYRFQRFPPGDERYRVDDVGPLRWRGHVVLNNNNRVITGWPDMPLTLSSRVEGWRLEAMTRIDERISAEDFRDRMPTRTGPRGDRAPQGASALGNHRSRFREENGLASWDSRDGTKGYNKAIKSRLTKEQIANNTTQGFTCLSPKTIRRVRDENREKANGAYAKRAGDKALSEKERAARAAGEKPTRTPMSSKRAKKAKKAPENEPSSDPEAHSENSQHHTPEDGGREDDEDDGVLEEDEGETGYDPDADNSTT